MVGRRITECTHGAAELAQKRSREEQIRAQFRSLAYRKLCALLRGKEINVGKDHGFFHAVFLHRFLSHQRTFLL